MRIYATPIPFYLQIRLRRIEAAAAAAAAQLPKPLELLIKQILEVFKARQVSSVQID